MKEYNGHRSWNAWNASMWISNDYDLEITKRQLKDEGMSDTRIIKELSYLVGTRTPDGAKFTQSTIRDFVKGN